MEKKCKKGGKEKLKHSSIRGVVAPLRAMYATALEDGVVRINPTAGVRVNQRRGEDATERTRPLTRQELAAFLRATPDEWRPFFEFLTHTGLRISETLGLTWDDIVFGERPMLRLRRQFCRGEWKQLKTGSSARDVPLSPGMAEQLWARGADERGADPVFGSEFGGHLRDDTIRKAVLNPTRKTAGVEWATFHTFRHTCASLLFKGGKDIRQVAEWLGHSDPAFTLRVYVHLMDDGLGGAEFFDSVTTGGGNGWQHNPAKPTETPRASNTRLRRSRAVWPR